MPRLHRVASLDATNLAAPRHVPGLGITLEGSEVENQIEKLKERQITCNQAVYFGVL